MTSSCQQQSTNVGASKRGGDTRKNKEQEAVEAKEYMQGNTSRAATGTATYRLMVSATTVGRVEGPCRRGRVASRAINGKKERSDVSDSRL